jgi:HEAT repeat protein
LDLHSLEALFAALNSQRDEEVVAALELLAQEGRVRLIPALILYHPAQEVVLRALELMAESGRTDFVPVAERLLGHAQADVRAAALRARMKVAPDQDQLRAAIGDPSPLVRAGALAGLVSAGAASGPEQLALNALADAGDLEGRRALARALSEQPAPVFEPLILELSTSADPEVQIHTARAMGRLQSESFLPALLPLLVPHEAREHAREALLEYGDKALAFLEESLADRGLPHDVRRHLPRTISRFAPTAAARILVNRLIGEEDGMVRFKILRGLGRLATDHPGVEMDQAVLADATTRTVAAAFRLRHWRAVLGHGAPTIPPRAASGHDLLVTLLRDKEVHARERLFRLLSLQLRHEDLESVYRGLDNTDPRTRASSRELLENLLAPPLRHAVLALVDDAPEETALAQAAPYYVPGPLTYTELLVRLLDEPGETLRCLAAYHVGELGLVELRPRLESFLRADAGLFVTRVIERALRLLNEARPERVPHAR